MTCSCCKKQIEKVKCVYLGDQEFKNMKLPLYNCYFCNSTIVIRDEKDEDNKNEEV